MNNIQLFIIFVYITILFFIILCTIKKILLKDHPYKFINNIIPMVLFSYNTTLNIDTSNNPFIFNTKKHNEIIAHFILIKNIYEPIRNITLTKELCKYIIIQTRFFEYKMSCLNNSNINELVDNIENDIDNQLRILEEDIIIDDFPL